MDPRLLRAHHLLDVGRPRDAAAAIAERLAEVPDDADALALMAIAKLEDRDVQGAIEQAEAAVGAGPDEVFGWIALGHARLAANRNKDALEAAQNAVRLAPGEARTHGLLAAVHADGKRWQLALDAADEGLACDPENDQCTNLRAMALRQLGRRDEADLAGREQLRRTPDDAVAHANQGWTALHGGDRDRAAEHFREALRLDPSLEWARNGLRETLLAGHWFYRPVLRWFLWIGSFTAGKQVLILLGGYAVYRVALGQLRNGAGALAPLWIALVAIYGLFAVITWFAGSIASGLLLFSADGRRVLTPFERLGALTVCAMLFGGATLAALGFAGILDTRFGLPGLMLVLLALPTKLAFEMESPRARLGMAGFVGICVCFAGYVTASTLAAETTSPERVELIERTAAFDEEVQRLRERQRAADLGRLDAAELDALEAAKNALVAERARIDAAIAKTGLRSWLEERKAAQERRGTLTLVLVVLCFWASQFVAGFLASRYPAGH